MPNQEMSKAYTSPDGVLRLLVVRDVEGWIIGFDGGRWHTHGDLLVPDYGTTDDEAVRHFVDEILSNRLLIAISRRGSEVLDVRVTDHREAVLEYTPSDQSIELRAWNGSLPADWLAS